jgi:hypothetical protein
MSSISNMCKASKIGIISHSVTFKSVDQTGITKRADKYEFFRIETHDKLSISV